MKTNLFINTVLNEYLTDDSEILKVQPVSGGMINQSLLVKTNASKYFIKWNNDPLYPDLFEKEAEGLNALSSECIRVPNVVCFGQIEEKYFLVLEYIPSGKLCPDFWEKLGMGLAQLHKSSHDYYGWHTDNHIGKIPQINSVKTKWTEFFIQNRLKPQIRLAVDNGYMQSLFIRKFDQLFILLDDLLPIESPALIHGDLWSGNFMADDSGLPVVFDPAVYYAHREIEIAFTLLFGGFDHQFYKSYQTAFPLQPHFEERVGIYQLYPLLVHVNLFGPSYMTGISETLKRFAN